MDMNTKEVLLHETDIVEAAASPAKRMFRLAWGSTAFNLGFFIFSALLLTALIYPELSSVDPTKMNYRSRLVPPIFVDKWQWAHPLGTDQLGRDLLLRCLVGLRYSVLIGVTTVILMFIVGCGLGLISGFKGGVIDTIIMRLTDAQLSIPMIILAIDELGVSRPIVPAIITGLGMVGWPLYARVARSVSTAERKREYVLGVGVLSASD